MVKDYYNILGVTRTADDEEIKKAYRKLAMSHHPDRGGDVKKFQEIQEAYAVLGDAQKRQEYDNPHQRVHINMGGHGGFNFDDIFSMFGASMNRHRQGARINLWLDLEDVARGGPKVISIQVGSQISNVQVDIPVGVDDGDTIRYPRLSPDGHDLIITYRIKPHAVWQRHGRDIVSEKTVSVWDLILGGEVSVTDLTGTTLSLVIPSLTQPNGILRARGRGIPSSSIPGRAGGSSGDLLVRLQADIPKNISGDLIDAIRKERGL